MSGAGQGGADQGDGGEVRSAGADQGEQHHRAGVAELGQLVVGQRVDHGHERAAGVPSVRLLGGEVVLTERSVLRVRQGSDHTARHAHPGQRQALGVDQLDRYLKLLQRWNTAHNLTAVRDPDAMVTQHLADCLAAVKPLQRACPAGRLLDVGSGGGLPGVVLAIMMPTLDVTCVDTVGKKAAFVRQVAGALGLGNLRAVHARVEKLEEPPFDLITSRAFASLADFTGLTRGLLAPGGLWMAMKGRKPEAEVASLPQEVEVFHVEQLAVPLLDAARCLVGMRPPTNRSPQD